MRRNSLFLLLVAFVLIITSVLPAFAADATEIKGYSKRPNISMSHSALSLPTPMPRWSLCSGACWKSREMKPSC